MRRAVILAPSGFTLANLFFGVFAIVSASRGDYERAALYVVLGGVMDTLDGRVARATKTGSRFGEELDSLVDAITFGVAPAMIVYFVVLNKTGWDWIWAFLFAACAVIRLARFNVEQAGRAKTHFHGLPSPAAGMTLATYYPFSQSALYTETIIGDFEWHMTMRFVMMGLAFLMVSDVAYPAVPTIGYRTPRQIIGSIIVAGTVIGVFVLRLEFFFPALSLYILYGVVKTVILGLIEKRGAAEELLEEEEIDGVAVIPPHPAPVDPLDLGSAGRRRRRRGRRGTDQTPVQPQPPIDPGLERGG
jgi:CDP-diacylglycerol--serine O-phosphatidyltransferase